jgi:hypothetical protein
VHCGRPRKIVDRVRVADMLAAGVSMRGIARQLGISLGKVQRTVSAPVPKPRQMPVSKVGPKGRR